MIANRQNVGMVYPSRGHAPTRNRATEYGHPAHRGFGVSVVEAMRAGLPPIVTSTTGARSAVEAVDEGLVVPPTSRALGRRVSEYFGADVERRRALSRASRRASDPYDEATKTEEFRAAFDAMTGDAEVLTAAP